MPIHLSLALDAHSLASRSLALDAPHLSHLMPLHLSLALDAPRLSHLMHWMPIHRTPLYLMSVDEYG